MLFQVQRRYQVRCTTVCGGNVIKMYNVCIANNVINIKPNFDVYILLVVLKIG